MTKFYVYDFTSTSPFENFEDIWFKMKRLKRTKKLLWDLCFGCTKSPLCLCIKTGPCAHDPRQWQELIRGNRDYAVVLTADKKIIITITDYNAQELPQQHIWTITCYHICKPGFLQWKMKKTKKTHWKI